MVFIRNLFGRTSPKDAARMIALGKARPVGPASLFELDAAYQRGEKPEFEIEMTFQDLDIAILSDKGPTCLQPRSPGGSLRLSVLPWDGNDPSAGMPVLQGPLTGNYRFQSGL
jgi:hypothetical protein